ncbi:MAG: SMC-Scp complex subunit ScpB [Clostridia bacterium]|nr:SMC-Scp complex subunit ScpB [Clostridia bacterium]
MENLESILESILFVNGDAVDIADITSKLDVNKNDIKNAVKNLQNKYSQDSGIVLLEFNNKLQFASNSKYADTVSLVLNPIRQRNLSRATLETASIIAYKQPVTRLEIEEIRGVSSDYAINILLEHNLIEIVGRKEAVGKPALFGTTDEFLKRFNISSIDDLPDYNELLDKVKVIRSGDDRLYNHFEVKPEEEQQSDVAMAEAPKVEDLEVLESPVFGEKEADMVGDDLETADDYSGMEEIEEVGEFDEILEEDEESFEDELDDDFDEDDDFDDDDEWL